ncbi:hypothetical protein AB4Y87_22115 [Paenarthrobacter sp. RAF54_2]
MSTPKVSAGAKSEHAAGVVQVLSDPNRLTQECSGNNMPTCMRLLPGNGT